MSDTCARCNHRLVHHGDRAITACDGASLDLNVQGAHHGPRVSLCPCPGWQSK